VVGLLSAAAGLALTKAVVVVWMKEVAVVVGRSRKSELLRSPLGFKLSLFFNEPSLPAAVPSAMVFAFDGNGLPFFCRL
jgi:hypothetical protein